VCALWNLFDLTPEGRGTDWYPERSYERPCGTGWLRCYPVVLIAW
jgi:hypothetical protein